MSGGITLLMSTYNRPINQNKVFLHQLIAILLDLTAKGRNFQLPHMAFFLLHSPVISVSGLFHAQNISLEFCPYLSPVPDYGRTEYWYTGVMEYWSDGVME